MPTISLSFDDGRKDVFDFAFPIIKKYNLVASIHVTTGFIDGTFNTNDFGINRKPLSIENIKVMFEQGMEISSHGDRHVFEKSDFNISIKKIKQWVHIKNGIGFSVPNSNYDKSDIDSFICGVEKVKYIRVGRNPICYSFRRKICYLLYHLTHLQFFYNFFNKPNILKKNNFEKYSVYSVVIKKDTKVKSLTNFLKELEKDECVVLMFHSIVEKPSDKWEWSKTNFKKLCQFLHGCHDDVITLENMTELYGKSYN